jgi:hypothetical protein
MQHCKACGAELPNDALFCGRCGKRTDSDNEFHTNVSDAPIEDTPKSAAAAPQALNELQDSTSENGEHEEEQIPDLPLKDDVAEEEQTSSLPSEGEDDEQTPYQASQLDEEQQTQLDYMEPTGTLPDDPDPEAAMPIHQFADEHPLYAQAPSVTQEAYSPRVSTQQQGARSVSKCLLFFIAGLIIIAGIVAAFVGLFRTNLPGTSGSSHTLSNSSLNDIIKTTGSSVTASVCVKSSTPTTSGTNGGTGFTLFASSGCSSVIAAPANSFCLIFPYNAGASHKYIFDVSHASIDNQAYHLVLGVAEYTGPTIYNDAKHISIGISDGATGKNFSWLYHSGIVTINNDQQSGTMDVVLASVHGVNTIHVVGNWACGRQIKNT